MKVPIKGLETESHNEDQQIVRPQKTNVDSISGHRKCFLVRSGFCDGRKRVPVHPLCFRLSFWTLQWSKGEVDCFLLPKFKCLQRSRKEILGAQVPAQPAA